MCNIAINSNASIYSSWHAFYQVLYGVSRSISPEVGVSARLSCEELLAIIVVAGPSCPKDVRSEISPGIVQARATFAIVLVADTFW
jgi:hypothetical protein